MLLSLKVQNLHIIILCDLSFCIHDFFTLNDYSLTWQISMNVNRKEHATVMLFVRTQMDLSGAHVRRDTMVQVGSAATLTSVKMGTITVMRCHLSV